jgi:2-methylaconitate cis-trans-isomerase PrpF
MTSFPRNEQSLRIPAVFVRGGTSKGVLLSRSSRADCDVDYLFGASESS